MYKRDMVVQLAKCVTGQSIKLKVRGEELSCFVSRRKYCFVDCKIAYEITLCNIFKMYY